MFSSVAVVHGPNAQGADYDEPEPPHYVVQDLGTLNPAPNSSAENPRWRGASYATGISENGIVTGVSEIEELSSAQHVFRWSEQTDMQDLGTGPFAGFNSRGWDVNSNGVVVGEIGNLQTAAFRASGPGQLERLGRYTGAAYTINDNGLAVGWDRFHPNASIKPAFWTPAGPQAHHLQGRYWTGSAKGVNNANIVVGHVDYAEGGPDHAVMWLPKTGTLPGKMIDLHPQAALGVSRRGYSRALAVSDKNWVAGYFQYFSAAPKQAAVWRPVTGFLGIGNLSGGWSVAQDVNDSNVVVGDSDGQAFMWTDELGMFAMDKTLGPDQSKNWKLLTAAAINDAGWVVGQANHAGQLHAYLAKPGDWESDPPTSSLACTALLGAAAHAAAALPAAGELQVAPTGEPTFAAPSTGSTGSPSSSPASSSGSSSSASSSSASSSAPVEQRAVEQ